MKKKRAGNLNILCKTAFCTCLVSVLYQTVCVHANYVCVKAYLCLQQVELCTVEALLRGGLYLGSQWRSQQGLKLYTNLPYTFTNHNESYSAELCSNIACITSPLYAKQGWRMMKSVSCVGKSKASGGDVLLNDGTAGDPPIIV